MNKKDILNKFIKSENLDGKQLTLLLTTSMI